MIDKRRALTAGAVLLMAMATGHLMQNGGAFASKFAGTDTPADAAQVVQPDPGRSVLATALPVPPKEMILPPGLKPSQVGQGRRVASIGFFIDSDERHDAPTPSFFQSSCVIGLTVLPEPGAMVRLQLDAPCYRNQRINIAHVGLEFADATGPDGSYGVSIPVFDKHAAFSVTFADGNSADAKTLGLSVDGLNRVAVSWQGGPGIHIHALELGADFDGPGHIWAGSAGKNDPTRANAGGFLTVLGSPDVLNPRLAEVYTFSGDAATTDGAVRLIVEAEVSPQICGTSILGNTLQLSPVGALSSTGISLSMPECTDAGGFLVLKNLLQDMKIARN